MPRRVFTASLCLLAVGLAVWWGRGEPAAGLAHWEPVRPGIYRTKQSPFGYAVVSGGKALLIDATVPPEAVAELKAEPAAVLLTHYHRDTAAFAAAYRKAGVPVRAAKEATPWLTPEGVTRYWAESIPLRDSRTAYFVLPEGVHGVDCSLEDGKGFAFGEWTITPLATPGHSRDHLAFLVRPTEDTEGARLVFVGDALHSSGKLWTPFTIDWDHWTDAGLKPAAESLRGLAKLDPAAVYPAHGPAITKGCAKALADTAAAVEEAAFLKSFERYTNRLGDVPKYPFLVEKEQVGSGGDKPWSRVSDHLWLTGNTYVLRAKDSAAVLVLDPWGERSTKQIAKLLADEKLGPVEVVAFSHAHYDHFDGVYTLPGRDRCQVWALDLVAGPLKEPFRFRAPFLDPRPIRFTKEFAAGETADWGGYTFKFHHLPGQTWFTAGVEATIDGKHALFTADNWFHQEQYSGSGGWMGLNRSTPAAYAASARRVLEIAPDRVLAEHGGPFAFDAEDFRRRVRWGEAAGNACDALCVSGDHRRDWNPHRVTAEPVLQTAKPGAEVRFMVRAEGRARAETVAVTLTGRGVVPDQQLTLRTEPDRVTSREVVVKLPADFRPGRHVFALRVRDESGTEPADPFVAVDVTPP
ncbi:MAG: MBL fold metallo-hydrolase [Gemmataceae bacterium]|nr:MBL fold metallo-hydrolase [Gemmataceae bacterium]